MAGWQPIQLTDFAAWLALTGNIVRPEEMEILRDMDTAYLAIANSKEGDKGGSGQEMTAAAFDAVFG